MSFHYMLLNKIVILTGRKKNNRLTSSPVLHLFTVFTKNLGSLQTCSFHYGPTLISVCHTFYLISHIQGKKKKKRHLENKYLSRLEAICIFLQSVERVHECSCMQSSRSVLVTKSPLEHLKKHTGKDSFQFTCQVGSLTAKSCLVVWRTAHNHSSDRLSKACNFAISPLTQNLKSSPWQRPNLQYFTLKDLAHKYFLYRN